MVKKLGILLMIGISFAGGYYVGNTRLTEISHSLTDLKKNMKDKTSALEAEINRLRLRINLVDLRNHLTNSINEFEKRNFGNAKNELEEALKKVDQAHGLAGEDLKSRLVQIKRKLIEINSSPSGFPSQFVNELKNLKKDMDRLIEG